MEYMWHTWDSIQSAFVASNSASVIENVRLGSSQARRMLGEMGKQSYDRAVLFFIQKENILFG